MARSWCCLALASALLGLTACGRVAPGPAIAQAPPASSYGAAGSPVADEVMLVEREVSPLPKGLKELDRVDFGGLHYRLVGHDAGPMASAMALLRGRPQLLGAEPNRVVSAWDEPGGFPPGSLSPGLPTGLDLGPAVNGRRPNDEFLPMQHGLLRTRAPLAWARTVGEGVTVAVLDTGIDPKQSEFENRVRLGEDFTFRKGLFGQKKDKDAALDDHGHGTHVAGIVGAAMGNQTGIAGVAPACQLLGVKVLDAKGKGSQWQVLKGVAHAAAAGARIINLSLGGPVTNSVERRFYEAVVASGVLLVAAAGNEQDAVSFPGAYPGVLAVGAVDEGGALAGFSNRGAALGLVAPGVGVLSLAAKGRYELRSGSSMAAPFVSGAAALLWALHPEWSAEQVRAALLKTSRDLGAPGRDASFGFGELDVAAAVAAS